MKQKSKNRRLGSGVGNRIMLSFTVLIYCIMLVSSIIMFSQTKSILEQSTKEQLEQRLSDGAKLIQREINSKWKQLEYISKMDDITGMDWNKQYPALVKAAEDFEFEHIFVLTNEGIGYYAEDGTIRNQAEEEFFHLVKGDTRAIRGREGSF